MSGTPKMPDDCFAYYVALGAQRSYEEVAKRYSVHKRTVARAAERERWPERLEAIEAKTREMTDAKLATDLHEMNLQHAKLLRAMSARVAAALQQYPLESAMEAMRGAEMVIKLQRLLAGQPIENAHVSVERVTKEEISRFLTTEPEDDWGDTPLEGTEGDDGQSGDQAATG